MAENVLEPGSDVENSIEHYKRLTQLPLSQLYEGGVSHNILLAESALVISLKDTPNKYGCDFIKYPFTVEFTCENGDLDLHIWNDEGVITPRPILLTGMLTLGASRLVLRKIENTEYLLICELFCESGNGMRTLKAFALRPEIKKMISHCLKPAEPGQVGASTAVIRQLQRVESVQVSA